MRAHPPLRPARVLAVLAVAALLAGGCTVVPIRVDGPASVPGGGFGRRSAPLDTAAANEVVQRSLKDVERFWAATFPAVAGGRPFTPVAGGYHPYTSSDPPPGCGSEAGEYQPNAFYCPVGDFIAWDAQTLIPQLHEDFGPLLVGVVMAHEYGHAVQPRLGRGSDEPTVVLEQQADCFAGAWVADVMAGNSTAFRDIRPEQLDSTVAGLLMLRDQPGTSAQAPQAHGNAFDRIRAFQEGVEQKATACVAYRAGNLPVTEVPFSTEEEAATGGNLPYEQAVGSLARDAEQYWQRTYPRLADRPWAPLRIVPFDAGAPPECAGRDAPAADDPAASAFYCAAGDYVAFDNRELGPALHQRIGDNAVGMLLGDLFARAAQQRRDASTEDRAGQLAVDCLAGTWTNDLLTRTGQDSIRLSPGDLDEAVAALLVLGREAPATGASAFDRIAAYRNGVLEGLPSCD